MALQWIARGKRSTFVLCLLALGINPASAVGAIVDTPEALKQAYIRAVNLQTKGHPLEAAGLFFDVYTGGTGISELAVGRLSESLIASGHPQAATYFFIKTLQTGNRAAIRRLMPSLPTMIDAVGGDVLRSYILANTSEADYDDRTRSHFFYFLGKDMLLKGRADQAISALTRVTANSSVEAQTMYLRGTALAILGKSQEAIEAFSRCRKISNRVVGRNIALRKESVDMEARCTAGLARSYYQAGQHDKAEETYDEISKATFVWTDILFEQAWNSYAKADYNRALGKLVTYRSPSLRFLFNPETDVLRAQAYLALCLYGDVNKTVNDFNSSYSNVGARMKDLLLQYDQNIEGLFSYSKQVFYRKLHTDDSLHRAINRFIRGPYFTALVEQERETQAEAASLRSRLGSKEGFGAFLDKVLNWRQSTVRMLGGIFVKNSLYDIYKDLLSNLDRMSFIKLEMLKESKSKLQKSTLMSEDEDGVLKRGASDVERHDYQYFWTFNGEFWADELGDYVFALASECGR